MTINPWEWHEYRLIVSFRNRALNDSWLLCFVSQEEFMEQYIERYEMEPRNVPLTEVFVTPLTEEAYNLLEPFYSENRKME